MPLELKEIDEHQNKYGIRNLETMHTTDYRQVLENEAFFWGDPHGFVMHQLSGERIVTNTEQLDALLDHLEGYRRLLTAPPEWLSEK